MKQNIPHYYYNRNISVFTPYKGTVLLKLIEEG